MQNAVAIVAEYNPFHNGHKFHIEAAKKETGADFVFVVMSSSFIQRGDCAVYDKWVRTKAALLGGADIVIELPVIYSTSSAENFARGAIRIIESTGIADKIAFGVETDNLDLLKATASILSSPPAEFTDTLKKALDKGLSFPSARAEAISLINNNYADILNSPNNILAVEYLKALELFNSGVQPCLIHRTSSEYNSEEISGDISSATAIRKALKENRIELVKHTVPSECFDLYSHASPLFADDFSDALGYVLRTMSSEEISNISGISEGLENRILKTVGEYYEISDICSALKTKRYTYTRIMRTLFHILLGITKEHEVMFSSEKFEPYIRVLGFRKSAEPLIKELSHKASAPIIMNINKDERKLSEKQRILLDLEKKATDLYFFPHNGKRSLDYTMPIIIEKDK
ncbi:hypothetical protein SDC9_72565 [bioreactor metagenome]|uniref:tRNA(Met) cytidine acetate ligase n=1 Tax=bioreactor metagenome TaxID=1076179 RepID=A0A644YIX3_9ZZZZ|nr:nucleotidyltransferase [Candidatus Metalachnospira sp.]